MKVKEESVKAGLKLSIQKTTMMASGPITSWQIDGEIMETVRDFIFSGSRITAEGNCSDEIKRCLLLGRKAMTNLDSILKRRGTKEPFDEGERGERKSRLKTQHSKNEDHGTWSHHFMANRWGNNRNRDKIYFIGLKNHCRQ